ncbi:MAG: hypothetical protein N3H30_01435 [Candidatus Micrarchaeota archaeon]|nr:hypothetical protein [Candidatus Micrarchaeota archaeon]
MDVRFKWDGFRDDGYSAVFSPNLLGQDSSSYNPSKVNIAVIKGPEQKLPPKYDLVNYCNFISDPDSMAVIRDKGHAVELCVADIRNFILKGKIAQVQFFCGVLRTYRIPYVFTSGATCEYEVKSPKEISFIAEMLGFTQRQALYSMSETASLFVEGKQWH